MATYAFGDLQGCYTELCELLERIGPGADDRLWFAGDLVNRGPGSLECLRLVHSLGDQAQVVLGNHDLHLLAVAHGQSLRKKDTLQPILEASDRQALLHWLQRQPLLVRDTRLGFAMVHAGIPPQWTLAQAQARAAEVEARLASPRAPDFFARMYGNEPACWSPDLAGMDRLRLITNYLTRMRFCDAQGCLELKTKTPASQPPPGYRAWFEYSGCLEPGERLVFGHWAALEGRCDKSYLFPLDTGCVWGGRLTAMRLEDGQQFSVPAMKPSAS